MASIKKRGNSYLITVSCGRDMNNKQILKTVTYEPDKNLTPKQQEKALQRFALDFEEKVKSGKYLNGDKMSFADFVKKWEQDYALVQLEETTVAGYRKILDLFLLKQFGHLKISMIKPFHIQSYYNSLLKEDAKVKGGAYSTSSIKKIHGVLSSILNVAVKWNVIDSNPCEKVFVPKNTAENRSENCFDLEQCQNFLEALEMTYPVKYRAHCRESQNGAKYDVSEYVEMHKVDTQFKLFFQLALFGQFRRGELIALEWSDFDFDNNTVTINKAAGFVGNRQVVKRPKTKKSNRTVKIPVSVMRVAKEYKKEYYEYRMKIGNQWHREDGELSQYVFIQWDGTQMHLSTPTHKFKEIVVNYNKIVTEDKKLPEHVTLHGLRHTGASLLISQNTDVQTVASRLGHSSPTVTLQIYSHAFEKLDEEASNTLETMFLKTGVEV